MTEQLPSGILPRDLPTERDRHRQALSDLVNLSRQCAEAEAQIEQQQQQEREAAEKRLKSADWEIADQYRTLIEKLRHNHEQRIAEIGARFEEKLAEAKHRHEKRIQRVELDFKTSEREIKEKYGHAAWLAESLLEATQVQLREALKTAKEQAEKDRQWLEEKRADLRSLLTLYGHSDDADRPMESSVAPAGDDLDAQLQQRSAIEQHLQRIRSLQVPRLFVGIRPYAIGLFVLALAALGAQAFRNTLQPQWDALAIAVGSAAVLLTVAGLSLRAIGRSHVRQARTPLEQALSLAAQLSQQRLAREKRSIEERHSAAVHARDEELARVKNHFSPLLAQATQKRGELIAEIDAELESERKELESHRSRELQQLDQAQRHDQHRLDRRRDHEQEAARQRRDQALMEADQRHESAWAALRKRLDDGLASVGFSMPIQELPTAGESWETWEIPHEFHRSVRLGRMRVDLRRLACEVAGEHEQKLKLPAAFEVPVSIEFPRNASLLIQSDRDGRAQGLQILQLTMSRLLTSLPPGRVRFTIIDPVGLGQNFSGFMHLADHDESLVGGRIWTDADHIEQRLADLTEHMETVIQKYLRNEFETIDQYNAQAGELAEPYRFLVLADFPAGFEGDAARRLGSIISSGARCGVYTLILRDTRAPLPQGLHLEELECGVLNLVLQSGQLSWKDEVFGQFPLMVDCPPGEAALTRICEIVGRSAKDAKRVEVSFDTIAPPPGQVWSRDSSSELVVPIGRLGATRLQTMRLGRGVAQHALIAGKTGSGKSTLLHVLVTNLAMWYAPDQVEFYLVDFKKGVEFKTYATHALPHARAIAVESDREFGLSVLQRIDAELTRRGTLFRKLGIQDLPSYRATLAEQNSRQDGEKLPPLPRTLLIIDEFQEFFSDDDKLAQDAALLLDRLVRQGRAFGVHVLLGSQTIGGTSGLSRSTIGQMAVRVALQCSEADSQLILGDNNSAARLLSRPGEAIYNDAGGLVEHNSPFQVAWLSDERRDAFLEQIAEKATQAQVRSTAPAVFEGNAPAEIATNELLGAMLCDTRSSPASPAVAFLGEPVAIKDPTAIVLRRQSGANALIIGQQEESAMGLMVGALISLAAQHSPASSRFVILDGTAADSTLAGVLPQVSAILPHRVKLVEYRAVAETLAELVTELQRRIETGEAAQTVYILIYGLQRYRVLRKQEESFGFSMDDGEKAPQPDKQFADLLREGPAVGMHILAWADTPASVDRTLDRNSMREFDNRVLFQMSAADSSNLIDSPAANKLGFYRALLYSEEQGVMEKFRPYALPDRAFLERVRKALEMYGTRASEPVE